MLHRRCNAVKQQGATPHPLRGSSPLRRGAEGRGAAALPLRRGGGGQKRGDPPLPLASKPLKNQHFPIHIDILLREAYNVSDR